MPSRRGGAGLRFGADPRDRVRLIGETTEEKPKAKRPRSAAMVGLEERLPAGVTEAEARAACVEALAETRSGAAR